VSLLLLTVRQAENVSAMSIPTPRRSGAPGVGDMRVLGVDEDSICSGAPGG
jgi:hypothetical protein